ncbi:hypothetical protein QBC47DRAFT_309621, partial [Echria macrotheca]
SFLFIVNEFDIDYEVGRVTDQWFTYMPPLAPAAYRAEYTSLVFRYHHHPPFSSRITLADNHTWHRPSMSRPGHIVRTDALGRHLSSPPIFKTQSVFSCSAHLPLILLDGDAALGSTVYKTCPCPPIEKEIPAWTIPHFHHGMPEQGTPPGLSLIRTNCRGRPWVAGRDPEWMPGLVPSLFEHSTRRPPTTGMGSGEEGMVPRSVGLAGELPIIIGLMAFHAARRGGASEVFTQGLWEGGRWKGPRGTPVGYPRLDDCPRGFVIQVCLDLTGSEDPEVIKAARDRLDELEFSVLVEG